MASTGIVQVPVLWALGTAIYYSIQTAVTTPLASASNGCRWVIIDEASIPQVFTHISVTTPIASALF
jgi:hypothetical protein